MSSLPYAPLPWRTDYSISDPVLQRIYDISLKTLKECEQNVFEDGPKRDRRLWIGDLRLQALTDYKTFNNTDLVKRCIYLFAGYRLDSGRVAPCVFPDSPPYIDSWYFQDYSLFFISCLYDYMRSNGDIAMIEELYPIAQEQMNAVPAIPGAAPPRTGYPSILNSTLPSQ